MKENLKIIKKGNKEIELIITSQEFDSKLESFINWIDTEMKMQIGLSKINRDSLIREFEIYQMQKIKDMVNILVDEIKNLGLETGVIGIMEFVGDFFVDESRNLRKTLVFDNESRYWNVIIKSIWNEFNKMGIDNFVGWYGEDYNLTMFFKEHEIIDKWEIKVNE